MKSSLIRAFGYAFAGLGHFIKNDRNGKIHFAAAAAATAAGLYFSVTKTEWCILLLCFAMVLCMEMCNHALEKLCDAVQPEKHPLIKTAKDVAAGAVLCSAIIACVIGLLVFIPKITAVL